MKKHPNKEIQQVIDYAIAKGWELAETGNSAHGWGRLKCHYKAREGCQISIWSTPRNAFNHARHIKCTIDKCPH